MNKFWERFFYTLTFISQGPSFLNPTCYAKMHQKHHAYSDTSEDPHSPKYSHSLWSMMINTYHVYKNLLNDYSRMDQASREKYVHWYKLDRFALTNTNIYLWILIYLSIYISFKVPIELYFFLPLHFFIGPIQGAIVNWFGHKIGYRNFKLQDESKNSLPVDFLLMGELYQNNHHRYGNKINFAYKWYEIDFTYIITNLLAQMGIIKIKKGQL